MKNVVHADGHAIVRQGLKSLLCESNGYSIIGEANSFPELRDTLSVQQADILILELAMPGGSGLNVLKEIRELHPDLAILIFSHHSEEHFGLRAFKAGATGYLSKDCGTDKILETLQIISAGKRCFGKVTDNFIFAELNKMGDPNPLRHASLSDRELHVFIRIGEGKTITEISKDLSLSVKTVSTYRQRILKKMKTTTNMQIVGYCARHGLVESPK